MNDGPGLSAWDLANARTAPLDIAANERLARELAVDDGLRRAREASRAIRLQTNGPWWPEWARPIGTHAEGDCIACPRRLNNDPRGRGRKNKSGLCVKCGHRLGNGYAKRVSEALRMFRAGEWKP